MAVDTSSWFGRVMLTDTHGKDREVLYWLRLPSYGMAYNLWRDRDEFSQRVLFFLGRSGFRMSWEPVPEKR